MTHALIEIVRIVAVLTLVCAAAALLTPKGRVPLALRGICRILRKDRALPGADRDCPPQPVPPGRRLLGALLLLLAFALAVIKL